MLAPRVSRNVGTSQFWKIFFGCINPVTNNRDFAPILHSTPEPQRIANKIALLDRMKEAGIWLTDASIVSVNQLNDHPTLRKKILQHSWNNYTGPLIRSLQPTLRHIIVIGKQFPGRILASEISSLGIETTVVDQPQSHLRPPGYFPLYKTYYEICSGQD